MSGVPFVAMNFYSSFSAEKTENGQIPVQQILTLVAMRVHADQRK